MADFDFDATIADLEQAVLDAAALKDKLEALAKRAFEAGFHEYGDGHVNVLTSVMRDLDTAVGTMLPAAKRDFELKRDKAADEAKWAKDG